MAVMHSLYREPGTVAVESWRNALSKALSGLNEKFPQSIHEVILREGKYSTTFPAQDEAQSKSLAERLGKESVQSTVNRALRENQWQVTLTYQTPKDPGENLLGKDPFLPDTTLGASPRRSYLEIQVGE